MCFYFWQSASFHSHWRSETPTTAVLQRRLAVISTLQLRRLLPKRTRHSRRPPAGLSTFRLPFRLFPTHRRWFCMISTTTLQSSVLCPRRSLIFRHSIPISPMISSFPQVKLGMYSRLMRMACTWVRDRLTVSMSSSMPTMRVCLAPRFIAR